MNKKRPFKKSKIFYKILISFFFSICVFCLLTPISSAQDTISLSDIYIVTKGDTLWDISARFFGDPFVWPALWQKNPHIKDPHWIYPGQIINLRNIPYTPFKESTSVQPLDKTMPVEEKKTGIKIEKPSQPQYIASEDMINSCSYIIPKRITRKREQIEGWGSILKSKEEKINLSYLDHIYLDLGNQHVKPGQILTVFEVEKEIKILDTAKDFYNMIRILGQAKVLKVFPDLSMAQIIKSYHEINVGNLVKPYASMPRPVLNPPKIKALEGEIIASENPKEYLAEYDIIFLDKGKMDGLEPGNPLGIYRLEKIQMGSLEYPNIKSVIRPLGSLYILRVEDGTSTALISNSLEPIVLGDRVKISSND